LAALQAPVSIERIRVLPDQPRLSICAGSGKWKCIIGGAALGFVAGALVGQAFIPHEVTHEEYGCGFFGCGYTTWCDEHCDEPVTKIWIGGIVGGALGGVGGYYLTKAGSH
jgi:hypothetical protein